MNKAESEAVALNVLQALSGLRWTWPRKTVTEVYRVTDKIILLQGRPASAILSVIDEDGKDLLYVLYNGFKLILRTERIDTITVTVEYTYGSRPSPSMTQAITVLAAEILAGANGEACQLPERITSVTRQGVSWTMLDPQDYLTEGRTGIYQVDLALSLTGHPRGLARARVFTPDHMPPDRLGAS